MHTCFQISSYSVVGLFAVVLALRPAKVDAELLVYEPFDYQAGTSTDGLAATGLNLLGSYTKSTIQDLVVANPGLNYGNLTGSVPSVAGNRLNDESGAGSGLITAALADEILIDPGEAIYFSALFMLDDSTSRNRFARVTLSDEVSGDYLVFGEAVVGVRALRIGAETATTEGFQSAGPDDPFTDGQTLWLVGRYFNSPLPGGDELQLIGYDTAASIAIGESFDMADPNALFADSLDGLDIDLTRITSLSFEIRGANDKFIDEFRLATSFASLVVPEPSAAMLLALAAGGVGAFGRRAG